ncbi:AraC family transcriptional regulator [Rhodoplanes sp. Z2-YC6860]|uniref:AraC family transcriptional regulator n=1 Tax=Rhodoplanes sp. Z2-YC6860 TaxID=674703 RepID=UPI0018DCECC9|nr:AraC family transcriptional regulator [Rhodoplanes sp. Z2-YC6860]
MEAGAETYLEAFPIFETNDPEEMRNALLYRFGARSFDTSNRAASFAARGNHAQLKHIGISFCSYDADVKIAFPETTAVRQQFCLHGSAKTKLYRSIGQFGAGGSFIIPSNVQTAVDFSESYRQLVLRVETEFLDSKLKSLLGLAKTKPLDFRNPSKPEDPRFRAMLYSVLGLATQLNVAGTLLPPLILDELQQSITMMFLFCNHHNLSYMLEADALGDTSRTVRTVEDFIEENWKSAVTIEALANLTGVSARSIFKEFKKTRGYTPMVFVKKVRLKHSRTMLSFPDLKTSVTGVALACGFLNHGHFSRDYRETFGELPSVTLARAKRGS